MNMFFGGGKRRHKLKYECISPYKKGTEYYKVCRTRKYACKVGILTQKLIYKNCSLKLRTELSGLTVAPICGHGSMVERHLAKVDVAGSSPVARSNFL